MGNVGLAEKVSWVLRHEGPKALCEKILKRVTNPGFYLKKEVPYRPEQWLPSREELIAMREAEGGLPYRPKISVLLPVYNPPEQFLREAIESVLKQVYTNWELCIADDCSPDEGVREILREYEEKDERIHIRLRRTNGHISAASNSALELATGDFVALLDHDDLLAPHALFMMAKKLGENPALDFIYSNEDKIDEGSKGVSLALKACWSPDYFLSFMYTGHLSLYRRTLIDSVGGFREGFEGSQDHDLALRVTEHTKNIAHVPELLYRWRMHEDSVAANLEVKPYAFVSAKKAIEEALTRRGYTEAKVEKTRRPGVFRIRYPREEADFDLCIWGSAAKSLRDQIAADARVHLYEHELSQQQESKETQYLLLHEKLKFWKERAEQSQAKYLLLLDTRLEALSDIALPLLMENISREDISLVGGHLLTEAEDHIHGGYLVFGRQIRHAFFGAHHLDEGYAARLSVPHNVSAVSSLCLAVRREDLLASKVCEQPFESQEAVDLALALYCSQKRGRVLFHADSKWKLKGEVPRKYWELSDKDFGLLQHHYGLLDSFEDPYYPQGLDREKYNYQLSSPKREEVS